MNAQGIGTCWRRPLHVYKGQFFRSSPATSVAASHHTDSSFLSQSRLHSRGGVWRAETRKSGKQRSELQRGRQLRVGELPLWCRSHHPKRERAYGWQKSLGNGSI